MHLADGTGENGEVLGEYVHLTTVDGAMSGYDAVTWHLVLVHAEVTGLVRHEGIELDEGTWVQQCIYPLPGGHLALLMVLVLFIRTAAGSGPPLHLPQFPVRFLDAHFVSSSPKV